MLLIHNNCTVGVDSLTRVGIWWLMSSYLYYCRTDVESFLTDKEFDTLTHILIGNFDELQKLEYRTVPELITMERLRAGTAYDLREHDYPTITKSAAMSATKDKFWTLRQEFRFTYPHVKRLGYFYEMKPERIVEHYINREYLVNYIMDNEPAFQSTERYPEDSMDERVDRERLLLKHREAEDFYDSLLFHVDKEMDEGLVLGQIVYREGIGWIAKVYDPTRNLRIKVAKED